MAEMSYDPKTGIMSYKIDYDPNKPHWSLVKQVELTDECIDKIADAVVRKLADRKTEPSICDGCKFYDGEDCYSQEFCKVKDLIVTEYPQDGEVNLIGRDKTEAVVMAYDVYKELTEPQTDRYMTAEQTEDYRKMLDKAEHKVYGNIEDEPQTEREGE